MNNDQNTTASALLRGGTTLKDLPAAERPRERLLAQGAGRLTDAELVGILLGSGVRGASAVEIGRRLIARHGGVRGLARSAARDLAREKGVGAARAARLAAGVELARRIAAEPIERGVRLDSLESVRRHFAPLLAGLAREQLHAVLLDRRLRLIRTHLVSEGTLDEAFVHPREVFLPALR